MANVFISHRKAAVMRLNGSLSKFAIAGKFDITQIELGVEGNEVYRWSRSSDIP
jgi:hypothetical protein